ncbi:hypothetical protein [Streptomyces kaniharaensis]|nr:hypothetical protein [Streptomyces kaniharaensis]
MIRAGGRYGHRPRAGRLFLYLILDRHRANLAMARHRARSIKANLLV